MSPIDYIRRSRSYSPLIEHVADNPSAFGAVVRERRRQMGITQAQLADVAGVSRKAVIDIESGKPTAQWQIALSLARSLGLNVIVRPR
jgi:HTH-type transcriptional regulator/antitoxin HipB